MFALIRTDVTNPDFVHLVGHLDADLSVRDGKDHSFYAQFNKIDNIRNVIVAYDNGLPVGCGAVKAYAQDTGEIKRMYVLPEYRGRKIASQILQELEKWAHELNFSQVILETGKAQPEAIGRYTKSGYHLIPNYGQYAQVENSVCMQKATSTPAS